MKVLSNTDFNEEKQKRINARTDNSYNSKVNYRYTLETKYDIYDNDLLAALYKKRDEEYTLYQKYVNSQRWYRNDWQSYPSYGSFHNIKKYWLKKDADRAYRNACNAVDRHNASVIAHNNTSTYNINQMYKYQALYNETLVDIMIMKDLMYREKFYHDLFEKRMFVRNK